jgi:hypothetical protein
MKLPNCLAFLRLSLTPFRQARAVLHEVQAFAALPADLDRKRYLTLHPDVRHAAFDPAAAIGRRAAQTIAAGHAT